MNDNSSKRSHSDRESKDGNDDNENYDHYHRDKDMPLEGHARAMIDISNQVENEAHATVTEVNTNMVDGSIHYKH